MHDQPKKTRQKFRVTRRHAIFAVGSVFGLLLAVQIFYPNDRFLPFTHIDGHAVAFQTHAEVTRQLDEAYDRSTVAVYMGTLQKPVTSPTLKDADIHVDNAERLKQYDYPWYVRLVPTSIFWAGLKEHRPPTPTFGKAFDSFVEKKLMPSCRQNPVDATLRADGEKLVAVKAIPGGQCEKAQVVASIKHIAPQLPRPTVIRVARSEIAPTVDDTVAASRARELTERLKKGVRIKINDETAVIPAKDVLSWLVFSTKEKSIAATISQEKAAQWFEKNVATKVAVKPGVSYITTVDFTETSRRNGTVGRALDNEKTMQSVQQVIDGETQLASVVTKELPPAEQYTRTYSASDAGLSALMANFAKDNPGTYGVSMIELGGKRRRAEYNGNKQFVTASTYKLFVAYSLMKQIDAGKRDWGSTEACFNKMISLSDNPCSETFLKSMGLNVVTKDIQAIGLKNSTFMKAGGPYTTANDLTLMLGMIATSQNFSSTNQQRLVAAMRGNVYRKGIPAGTSAPVADKVGFLNGLLHDAAIVHSPKGTYVLAIMTDGSSWDNIAKLTKQLDELHSR